MNFSTVSNKSTLDNQTINVLSHDELMESYMQLKLQFDVLGKTHDKIKQDLYDTKRNYETALEMQEHLDAEVESVQKQEAKVKLELNQKIYYLEESVQGLTMEKSELADSYEKQVAELKKQCNKLEKRDISENENIGTLQSHIKQLNEECRNLLNEKDELKIFIEEYEERVKNGLSSNEILQNKIDSLTSEIDCLKSNLEYKKEELSSANDLISSSQEEICLLKIELQNLKADSSKHSAKGNSLFAEVEDKRQEMLQSLSQMREKYHHLKIDVVNKQKEVDDLLREKKTIWAEFEGQASHQDAVMIAGYENRITDLERVCDEQRREITRWYAKNLNPNSSELEQWITGVLAYKSEQCLRLSDDLASCSVDRLAKEKKIRQLHSQLTSLQFKISAKDPPSDQSYNNEITSVGVYRPMNMSSKILNVSEDVHNRRSSTGEN